MNNIDSKIDNYIKLALREDKEKSSIIFKEKVANTIIENKISIAEINELKQCLSNSTILESDKEFWKSYYTRNENRIKDVYKVSSFNEYYGIIKSAANLTRERNLRKFQETPIKRIYDNV